MPFFISLVFLYIWCMVWYILTAIVSFIIGWICSCQYIEHCIKTDRPGFMKIVDQISPAHKTEVKKSFKEKVSEIMEGQVR